LHLLGYDDKQRRDAKKMHQREEELLLNLGYHVPVPD
jgi:probable rRNA maturation factor